MGVGQSLASAAKRLGIDKCAKCLPSLGVLDRRGGVTKCRYAGCDHGVKRLRHEEPKCLHDLATWPVLCGTHAPLALADARLQSLGAMMQACAAKLLRGARPDAPTVIIRSYGRPEFESYHAGKLIARSYPVFIAICAEDANFAGYLEYYARWPEWCLLVPSRTYLATPFC